MPTNDSRVDRKASGVDRKATSAVIGEALWEAQKESLLCSLSLEEIAEEVARKREQEERRRKKEEEQPKKEELRRKKEEEQRKKEELRRKKEEEDEMNAMIAKKNAAKKKKLEAALKFLEKYFTHGIAVTKHCTNGKTNQRIIFYNNENCW